MKFRSTYAYLWLFGGLLVWIVLFMCVRFDWGLGLTPKGWNNSQAAVLLGLFLLPLCGAVAHFFDNKERLGFKGVHVAAEVQRNLDTSAVSAMLSVQSIRSALAAGILWALLNAREHLAPAFVNSLDKSMFGNSAATFFFLVLLGLALSMITTVMASLCYDYAIRFDWKESQIKVNLLGKAHGLGVAGFYGLIWSLAAVTALFNLNACIIASCIVFCVLWFYYFFPKNLLPTTPPKVGTAATPNPNGATLTADVSNAPTNAFFQYGASDKYGSSSPISEISFKATIPGLKSATAYHYRFVNGTLKSDDGTFTTTE